MGTTPQRAAKWRALSICALVLIAPAAALAVVAVESAILSASPRGLAGGLIDQYGAAWGRSVGSALWACSVTGLIALVSAWALAVPGLRPSGAKGPLPILTQAAPLAVAPLLIGVASFAYLFKDLGRDLVSFTGSDSRGGHSIMIVEAVAQALRYGPLLLWLFLVTLMQVPPARRSYAQQAGLTGGAYVRIELIPRWLAPLLVVLAFTFQDAANDFLVSQLAVRPSVATGTELLSHAMGRNFSLLLSLGSPPAAISHVVTTGALAAVGFALVFAGFALACLAALNALRLSIFDGPRPARINATTSRGAWIVLAGPVLVLTLAIATLLGLKPGSWDRLIELVPSATLSALAALAAWAIAAPLTFLVREQVFVSDGSAGTAFVILCGLALAVGFIPPLSLAVAVFSFAYSTGLVGDSTSGLWLFAADVLRFTPIAFILLTPAALAIGDAEIQYLKDAGASAFVRSRVVFFAPNLVLHLAIVVICFNLILNEGVIASVFQSQIPSLTDLVRRATTGRAANEAMAATLILAQGAAFALLLWLWGRATLLDWRMRHAAH